MVIRSFSEICWTSTLSSNILYPSNVNEEKRIKDQGSISKSISHEQNNLFHVTEKNPQPSTYTIPCRAIARHITFIAIGIIAAPFGIVYHGAQAARYAHLRDGDKMHAHGKALSSDMTMAALTILSVYGALFL